MAFYTYSFNVLLLTSLLSRVAKAQDENSNASNAPPVATGVSNAAGASGNDAGAYSLSKGGLVAIVVVVVIVALVGIGSTVLYFVAKKRQWEVRKSIKRVSRKVGTAISRPVSRRGSMSSQRQRPAAHRGAVRLTSPPRTKMVDLEKGVAKGTKTKEVKKDVQTKEIDNTQAKKWGTILPGGGK